MLEKILNHKVVKSGIWYTISNFFLRGLGFITIPIFTRLLSTADYGVVAIYMTYMSIVTILISLDLGHSAQRGKIDYPEDFNNYIYSVVVLSFCSFLIFGFILTIFYPLLSRAIDMYGWVYFLMIVHAYGAFLLKITTSKYQLLYQVKKKVSISLIAAIFSIVLSIVLILTYFSNTPSEGKIVGAAVFSIAFGFVVLLKSFLQGKKNFYFPYWKSALLISLPYILHNLSGIVNAQFDRVLINKYLGSSDAGIYSFSYNVGMLVLVIWVSLNTAFNPFFFEKIGKVSDTQVRLYCKLYRDLFSLLYVIILYMSPEIVRLLAVEAYLPGLALVPWIFLALFFQVLISFETKIEYYYKKTYLTPIGTFIAAGVNVGLNILLIPRYGYVAAAVTTVVSYCLLFIYHFIATKYVLKVTFFGARFHLKAIILAIISTGLFVLYNTNLIVRVLSATIISTLLVIELIVKFKELKRVIK